MNDYATIKDLKDDVGDYIEFYNHKRFHQTLGYKKPMGVYLGDLENNEGKKAA